MIQSPGMAVMSPSSVLMMIPQSGLVPCTRFASAPLRPIHARMRLADSTVPSNCSASIVTGFLRNRGTGAPPFGSVECGDAGGGVAVVVDLDEQLIQRLREGVHLVVVGAVGERGGFLDQVADPGGELWTREVDVLGFDERAHGVGAGDLAALGVDGNEAVQGAGEVVHDCGAVGLVLDVFGDGLGPPGGHLAHALDGFGEPVPAADLVE